MDKKGLVAVVHHFRVEKKGYTLHPITQGFINDTFLVFEGAKPQYILQRINTDVFANVPGLMGNMEKALAFLKHNGYRSFRLVRTSSGGTYYESASGHCWRLMTYIDHSIVYDTTTKKEVAFEAGRIIGKFHELLEEANPDDFVDTIPRFHDLAFREQQFNKAFSDCALLRRDTATQAIQFANGMLMKLKRWDPEDLPSRICHNDTKLNNILFSKDSHKAICLLDLDTLMKGYFHFDFGDAVRTIVNTAPEDEKEHDNIIFDKELFEAFVTGLGTSAGFLTQQEKEVLPFGAVLLPFLHGLRALTDYLNGDVYYKVAYEDQNLDRCLSLFSFTTKVMEQLDYMRDVISTKLNC